MDLLLIFLFITACLVLILLFASLLFYQVPLRLTVFFVYQKPRQVTVITVFWSVLGMRITTAGDHHHETEILLGKRVVFSRTNPYMHKEPERVGTGLLDIRSTQDLGILIRHVVSPVMDVGSALYRETAFEEVRGKVRIGLRDPAATGMLYGGYWATRFILLATRIHVDMEPVFDRECLELELAVRFRVDHPLRLLTQGIQVLKSPNIRAIQSRLLLEKLGV